MKAITNTLYQDIISLCKRVEQMDGVDVKTAEAKRRSKLLKRKLTSLKTKNMTPEEFDMTRFRIGMKVIHKDKCYDIISIDFEERLIAIIDGDDAELLSWKRCENCKII